MFTTILLRAAVAATLSIAGAVIAAPTTMKAIQYSQFGPTSVLHIVDVPCPHAAAGEVLVRVRAAGVNSLDWGYRSGEYKISSKYLPITPGHDLAGDIVALGEGVTSRHVGEHVFAMMPLESSGGAYAEYVTIKADLVATQPHNLDAVTAAAVPLAALTAYQALFDKGGLKRGQTVLIHGASGGVGHFAVQLAKQAGAKVIGTSSAANIEYLKQIGVDTAIDYRAQKFEDVAKNVDLVIDGVGGDTLHRSYAVVKKGGAVVSLMEKPDAKELAQHGIHGEWVWVKSDGAELAKISGLIEQGAVKPEVSGVFSFEQAGAAQDQNQTGHTRGKVVIRIGAEGSAS